MLKPRLFLLAACTAVVAAACQASPVASDAGNASPQFGGQTLGSGHRSDGDGTMATEITGDSTDDARTGNLFGSGT
jgi:Spy/CpxP family protein refolding chaperone